MGEMFAGGMLAGGALSGGHDSQPNTFYRPAKPEEIQQNFLKGYNQTFGGTTPSLNNKTFRDSLSGYYGGQPFGDIATQLSQLNSFKPNRGNPFSVMVNRKGKILSLF